jgi:hypothetical protein
LRALDLFILADHHLKQVLGGDEVAARAAFPQTGGLQLGSSDGGLGGDRVEVLVADETGGAFGNAVERAVKEQVQCVSAVRGP